MSQWAKFFTPASYSGASWGQGDYSDGKLGPEDQILHHLCDALRNDALLAAVFGDRIDVMDARPSQDLRFYPRIYLYSGVTTPTEIVGKAQSTVGNIYVGVAYLVQSLGIVNRGEASIATVLHWVRHRISRTKNIVVKVDGDAEGATRTLARLQTVTGYDTLYTPDEMDRPYSFLQEVQAVYDVTVDDATGRIRNLTTAS